jgi:chorismate mutase-like protein
LSHRAGAILSLAACLATAATAPPAIATPARAAPAVKGFSAVQVESVDRLLRLIQARLEMAPAIAETRWKTMSRIEDSASEQTLLDAVRRQSAALRLDTELALGFAQAQIEAGKLIQAERHKQWAVRPGDAPKRIAVANPLGASTTEPELGIALLKAFRDSLDVLRRQGARNLLDARAADLIHVGGPDLLAAQTALKPLYELAN